MSEQIIIGPQNIARPHRRPHLLIVLVLTITTVGAGGLWAQSTREPHLTADEARAFFATNTTAAWDQHTMVSRDQPRPASELFDCTLPPDPLDRLSTSRFAVTVSTQRQTKTDDATVTFAGSATLYGYASASSATAARASLTGLIDRCSTTVIGSSRCRATRSVVAIANRGPKHPWHGTDPYDRLVIGCARFSATIVIDLIQVGNTVAAIESRFDVALTTSQAATLRLGHELSQL